MVFHESLLYVRADMEVMRVHEELPFDLEHRGRDSQTEACWFLAPCLACPRDYPGHGPSDPRHRHP